MRAVVQRVLHSSVTVDGTSVAAIGPGLMVLLGIGQADTEADADDLAQKIVNLRIFEDDDGKMNHSLIQTGGAMLVISQFTLFGDCRKGRRPSYAAAAPPEKAEALYNRFTAQVGERGVRVSTGKFRAMMQVALVNDGPVTLIVET